MDTEWEALNQRFPNDRCAMLQHHGGQRPVHGARRTEGPRSPSERCTGWAPGPDCNRPERRHVLGFGVGAEEKVREDPKRLLMCSCLSSCKSGRGRLFSGCFDQDDISQLTKDRRGDDVQLPLRSLTSGRFAETCIHATLPTEFSKNYFSEIYSLCVECWLPKMLPRDRSRKLRGLATLRVLAGSGGQG